MNAERRLRREARLILAEEYYMKERAYKRLQYGEPIKLSELSRNGNDLIQVLWELDNDVIGGQYTLPEFDNQPEELVLTRHHPIVPEPTHEQRHFNRDKTNPLSDNDRLSLCRAELAKYGK